MSNVQKSFNSKLMKDEMMDVMLSIHYHNEKHCKTIQGNELLNERCMLFKKVFVLAKMK